MPSTSNAILLTSLIITGYIARHNTALAAICLLISIIAYTTYNTYIYPFYLSPLRHLPEPKHASFPWAHASQLRQGFHADAFRRWVRETPNDGLIRFRVLGNQERLLLTSDQALKEVLVTKSYQFVKPDEAGFMFRNLLGNGVLVAEGDAHRQQRKALLPAFAFRHIKELYPLFWAKATQSATEIAKHKGTQLVYDLASHVTLDIIGQSGIGYDFNAVSNPDGEIVTVYRKLFAQDEQPVFKALVLGIPLPVRLFWRLPLPEFIAARKAAETIRQFAASIVKKKSTTGAIDIMSVAMSSGQFTDSEVVDQMMTFLAAGHETTSSALTWAVWLLCHHPEVQQRLRQEVRQLDYTQIDSTAIDRLPYLNAVASEVLRIIPTVPLSIRDATEDTTILGHAVPKGTRIFIVPWATNRDPKLWTGPVDDFKPERWLTGGGAANNFDNLTFLHGPRSCIGKDFARSEFMCILAVWVGRFSIRMVDDLAMEPVGWVTSHPKHKMPVVFEEVPGWSD